MARIGYARYADGKEPAFALRRAAPQRLHIGKIHLQIQPEERISRRSLLRLQRIKCQALQVQQEQGKILPARIQPGVGIRFAHILLGIARAGKIARNRIHRGVERIARGENVAVKHARQRAVACLYLARPGFFGRNGNQLGHPFRLALGGQDIAQAHCAGGACPKRQGQQQCQKSLHSISSLCVLIDAANGYRSIV